MDNANRSASSAARRTVPRTTTATNPLIIAGPRLGILNLLGPIGASLVTEDREKLSPWFTSCEEGRTAPPLCDVLLLYCSINRRGQIDGAAAGLRGIISNSKAAIVIVASENTAESYMAASRQSGQRANLVFTLNRKGTAFTTFFQRLFNAMRQRQSMPIAWVALAPQIPGQAHPDCPETIFVPEAGHIIFQ